MEIPNFTVGETYQVQKTHEFPVGKAISVALTLQELEIQTHVVALIGKRELCLYQDFLDSKEIAHTFFPVQGVTRSNVTVIDSCSKSSTHLRFIGFEGTRQNFDDINSFLKIMVQKDDFVIFSGSLPLGASPEFFYEPSEIIRRKEAKLIIDSSGERLKLIKMYNPYIIKANLKEMEIIVNKQLCETNEFEHQPSEEELYTLLDLCSELNIYKSKFNVLTLGKYGSLIFNRKEAYFAQISLEKAEYNIGCGDAFLGGLVYGLTQDYSLKENIEIATICGAANTLCFGPGIINKKDFPHLRKIIEIQRLR